MSQKMFHRIENTLQEFNRAVQRMNAQDRLDLELEYERLTGMECDDAAEIQTNAQFAQTIRQAYENMMRKKRKQGEQEKEEVARIYA